MWRVKVHLQQRVHHGLHEVGVVRVQAGEAAAHLLRVLLPQCLLFQHPLGRAAPRALLLTGVGGVVGLRAGQACHEVGHLEGVVGLVVV